MDSLGWLKVPLGIVLLISAIAVAVMFADHDMTCGKAIAIAVVILIILAVGLAAFVLIFS